MAYSPPLDILYSSVVFQRQPSSFLVADAVPGRWKTNQVLSKAPCCFLQARMSTTTTTTLFRSSSTPILGSFLSSVSFSESPNSHLYQNHQEQQLERSPSCFFHSFALNNNNNNNNNSCSTNSGVRRTLSDGNIHSLLIEDNHHQQHPFLETIPSLRIYSQGQETEEREKENTQLERTVTIGDMVMEQFGFSAKATSLEGPVKETGGGETAAPPLFLARGLGIDRLASGLLDAGGDSFIVGGGDGSVSGGSGISTVNGGGGGGGEQSAIENYYRKMVEEDPCNALLLTNYAQFLYETKGDLKRAEEYYSRAILAEPVDGEILSRYANLVWELHHDQERASTYFQRAVEAAPNDSRVLAAYASFLWKTEEEGRQAQDCIVAPVVPHSSFTSARA